jgi:hypothetical protein
MSKQETRECKAEPPAYHPDHGYIFPVTPAFEDCGGWNMDKKHTKIIQERIQNNLQGAKLFGAQVDPQVAVQQAIQEYAEEIGCRCETCRWWQNDTEEGKGAS